MPPRLWPGMIVRWLGSVPTTPLRICVTLVCVLATCAVYLVLAATHVREAAAAGGVTTKMLLDTPSWEPSGNWLMFLAGMAGIDTLQFLGKRKTEWRDRPPEAAGQQSGASEAPLV